MKYAICCWIAGIGLAVSAIVWKPASDLVAIEASLEDSELPLVVRVTNHADSPIQLVGYEGFCGQQGGCILTENLIDHRNHSLQPAKATVLHLGMQRADGPIDCKTVLRWSVENQLVTIEIRVHGNEGEEVVEVKKIDPMQESA